MAAMAAVGLGIAAYLTTVHYATVPLVCSSTGVVDCSAVTRSSYSLVPGTSVPITVPGMVWFAVSGVLAGIAVVTARGEPRWLRPLHAGWGLIGVVAALYLVFAEVVRLHRLCEWCTGVHILILITFLVALARFLDGGDVATG